MVTGVFAADQLKLFIERIERLEEEKKGVGDDVRDVYAEAKANGFDTKTMRKCVALRKQPSQQRDEEEALLDTYKRALGMKSFDDTPLGASAVDAPADNDAEPPLDDGAAAATDVKPKRGRKVRDPSDGSLVTVPPRPTDDANAGLTVN